jgi:predicted phosphodiesterase
MKILISGDLHGNFHELIQLQLEAKKANLPIDMCIQVGDFGFYERCFSTLGKMNVKKFPYKTFAIDGNHEEHWWLKDAPVKEWEEKHNLFYKPRGSIEEIDGSLIGFLGGALNVDRAQEGSTKDRTTNYILDVEIHEALEKFNALPKIDLMVTHTCPHSIGVGMLGHPYFAETIEKYCHDKGHSTGKDNDVGDGPLTRLYRGLTNKPTNWVFGHFHQLKYTKVDGTHFYCVGSSDSSDGIHIKKPFIYDTQKKEIEYFPNNGLMNFTGFHKTWVADPK